MNSANGHPLIAGAVVKIGSSRAGEWRRDFASTALTTWNDGKAVWIFRGLLDPIPQKKWGWVEGAEPLVRWKDFREFFMQLETSAVHGEFVQLPPTPSNLKRLRALTSSPPSE
jgi:hypothetical protein